MATKYLHVKGLAYASTEQDLRQFLGCQVDNCVTTRNADGRPSGEGFVVVTGDSAYHQVMAKNKQELANRYIEFVEVEKALYIKKIEISNITEKKWDGVIRLRGLPFQCDEGSVRGFFQGVDMSSAKIFLPRMKNGFSTGEGYVQFPRFSIAKQALGFHKSQLGDRYIEVYKSTNCEYRRSVIVAEKLKTHGTWSKEGPAGASNGTSGGNSWGGLNITASQPKRQSMGGMNGNMNGNMNKSFGSGPTQPKRRKNENQNGGFVKMENTNPSMIKGCPVMAVEPGCPYKHIITIKVIPGDSTNTDVQDFFRPAKAIAVNIKPDRSCDVAFKTHDQVLSGLDKNNTWFKGMQVNLICKSTM